MKHGAIVLSGRSCSGKSELATAIERNFSVVVFQKPKLLEHGLISSGRRSNSAAAAKRIESDTDGRWLKEVIGRMMVDEKLDQNALFVIDGVDSLGQVQGLRDLAFRVVHISALQQVLYTEA